MESDTRHAVDQQLSPHRWRWAKRTGGLLLVTVIFGCEPLLALFVAVAPPLVLSHLVIFPFTDAEWPNPSGSNRVLSGMVNWTLTIGLWGSVAAVYAGLTRHWSWQRLAFFWPIVVVCVSLLVLALLTWAGVYFPPLQLM